MIIRTKNIMDTPGVLFEIIPFIKSFCLITTAPITEKQRNKIRKNPSRRNFFILTSLFFQLYHFRLKMVNDLAGGLV
jgi:hypothetical protein